MKRFIALGGVVACALVGAQPRAAHADQDDLVQGVVEQLVVTIGGYHQWFENPDADPDSRRDMAEPLLDYAGKCAAAVQAALDGGVPADREISAYGQTVKLGEAAPICEKLRAAAQGILDEQAVAKEAELAPFKKALKGDKLELFLQYGNEFFGKGCVLLTTPKQLAKAKSWYVILSDTNSYPPRWTTRQYKFKGNKLVIDGKERSGNGADPPSKACP